MLADAQANALLAQAVQAHRGGETDRAMRLYQALLALDPANFVALSTLGMMLLQRSDTTRAKPLLEAATAAQPSSVETWMALGNLYAREADFEQAANAFSKVLALNPGTAAAYVNHGNALRRMGRLEQAIASLRQGLALDPGLTLAHYNLGIALSESGASEQASAAFRTALELNPDLHAARINLGNQLLRQNRTNDALACFEAVLARDPGYPRASYNQGVALLALGRLPAAIGAFERAVAGDPHDAEAHNNLVIALLKDRQPQAALTACERFLALPPATPKALAYKAAALIELDRRDEAAMLLDFGQLISHRQLPTGINAELAARVAAHETLTFEPADKSTYGGSQTGEFLDGTEGAAAALRTLIVEAVRDYIAALRTQLPRHPYVRGLPDRWRVATWAVSLQAHGYQGPHFHPDASVSGVYYVAVPGSVQSARESQGYLEFGRMADVTGGSGDPMIRLVEPREGLMLLFPSYFYHRTLPFEGEQSRISIAFDVLPEPVAHKRH